MDTIKTALSIVSDHLFKELVERPSPVFAKRDVIVSKLGNNLMQQRFLKKALNLSTILHRDVDQGTKYLKHALYTLLVLARTNQIGKPEAKQVIQQIVENKHFFDPDNAVYSLRLIRALVEEGFVSRSLGSQIALAILANHLHKTVGAVKDEALGLLQILYEKRLYHDDTIREQVRLAVERRAFGEV